MGKGGLHVTGMISWAAKKSYLFFFCYAWKVGFKTLNLCIFSWWKFKTRSTEKSKGSNPMAQQTKEKYKRNKSLPTGRDSFPNAFSRTRKTSRASCSASSFRFKLYRVTARFNIGKVMDWSSGLTVFVMICKLVLSSLSASTKFLERE